jgi:putative hydrolases of HD superfamily
MKTVKRDLELLYEIGALRFVQRAWGQFLITNCQNDIEHTYRVIWIALLLARYEGVTNTEKIIKMALVHDLSESRTGDVHYVSRLYTQRNEEKAIEDILKNTTIGEEMLELWKEYEKKESIEAKIVKDADNLDVDIELKELEAQGSVLNKVWTREVIKDVFYTESAKKMWEEIKKSNPHDWHVNGPNRLNSGDWKKD